MRILVIISIVTFGLVLWAAISIVQHISISLRRRNFSREQDNATVDGILGLSQPHETPQIPALLQPQPQPEFAPTTTATFPAPPPNEPPYVTPSSIAPRIAALVAILDAAVTEPVTTIAPPKPAPIPKPTVEVVAAHLPAVAHETFAAPDQIRITEFIPEELASDEPIPEIVATPERRPPTRSLPGQLHQPAAQSAAEPDTDSRRPVRSVHPHPSTPFALPTRRPDWVYFNKDMGDLSDPVPSRIRDRRANSR